MADASDAAAAAAPASVNVSVAPAAAASAPASVNVSIPPAGSSFELSRTVTSGAASSSRTLQEDEAAAFPAAPLVEIRYENISYHVDVPASQDDADGFGTVPKAVYGCATIPLRLGRNILNGHLKTPPRRVDILKDCSGVLRPGTLTLVLSPPGHGKTSFLRMLAKQLPAERVTGGEVTFSGSADGKAAGCFLGQLVQYVSQTDDHLAHLTVSETLHFVHANSVVDPAPFGYPHLAGKHAEQVDEIKRLLNLTNCWNTIVGNQMLRGVSGGEKKRVTDAEGLLTSAQAILLDEPSTGLDSSVTYDIVKRLKDMTRARGRTIAIALLQPSPETVALFDEVICLREGQVVYHGPNGMPLWQHFYDLGFNPPMPLSAANNASATGAAGGDIGRSDSLAINRQSSQVAAGATAGGVPAPVAKDMSDYLVDLLAQPAAAYLSSLKEERKLVKAVAAASTKVPASASATIAAVAARSRTASMSGGVVASGPRVLPGLDSPEAPITTARLAAAWKASRLYTAQMAAPPSAPKLQLTNDWARAQFGHSYSLPFASHLWLLMKRQFTLYRRNPLYLRARIILSIIMGIVIGGLYYQRTLAQSITFYSTFLNLLMGSAMANFLELALVVDNKFVAYKHVSHGTFPGSAYVLAGFLAHLPVSIFATGCFTAIIYFMVGLYASAGNFFFAWLIVFFTDVLFRNLICVFGFAGRNLTAAQSLPLPVLAILLLFAGFLITPNAMPYWLKWIWYIDAFAYGVRSLAMNQFLSTPLYNFIPPGQTQTVGVLLLETVGMQTTIGWKWGGVGFIFGSLVLAVLGSIAVFVTVQFDRNIGSRREAETPLECLAEKVIIPANAAAVVVPGTAGGAITSAAIYGAAAGNNSVVAVGQGAVGGRRSRITSMRAGPAQDAAIRAASVRMLVNTLSAQPGGGAAPLSPVAEVASPVDDAANDEATASSTDAAAAAAASAAAAAAAADYHSATDLDDIKLKGDRTVAEALADPATRAAIAASVLQVEYNSDDEDSDAEDHAFAAAALAAATGRAPAGGEIVSVPAAVLRMESRRAVPATASASAASTSSSSSAIPFEPTSIVWKDLVYKVTLKDGTVKTLLNGISGCAEPGKLLALMGASGAGKTTLMDVILGRKTAGKLEGQILVNGRSDISVTSVSAYVEQTDQHHSLTTVREAVQISAALRLPADVTTAQRSAFVDEILELLELHPIAGRIVGTPGMPGSLAPAEFKRLTIAVELASNSPVVFLDEPTSGLDSRAAASVMKAMRKIADTGRALIATIHQPSAALFYQFDSLLLMQRGGYEVFFGDIGTKGRAIVRYLMGTEPICQRMPPYPRGMNVAAYMLSAIQGGEDLAGSGPAAAAKKAEAAKFVPTQAQPSLGFIPGADLQSALFASDLWKEAQATINRYSSPKAPSVGSTSALSNPAAGHRKRTPGFCTQLGWLLQRQWLAHLRNLPLNFGRIVTMIALSLVFGTVWYMTMDPLPSSYGPLQTAVSAIFFTFAFPSMIQLNTGMPPSFLARAMFYRETSSEMYSGWAYGIANMIVELPWIFFLFIISLPMMYFMMGLSSSASVFFFHYLVASVLGYVYWLLGQFLAAACPSFEVAQALGPSFLSNIFFLFAGMFSPPSQMASGLIWLMDIDPIHHTFSAVLPGQFFYDGPVQDTPMIAVTSTNGTHMYPLYSYVSQLYDVNYDQRWTQFGYLVCFIAVFAPLYLLAIAKVRWIVR